MSQMVVSMIMKLMDQISGPLKSITGETKKFEDATKAAGNAQGKIKSSDWTKQQNEIRKAREEAERYGKTLDRVAKLSQIAMGAQQLAAKTARVAELARGPVEKAREFERQVEELARAAGLHSKRKELGRSALGVQQATGVGWEDIIAGRQQFVTSGGGGDMLTQIIEHEKRLATLARAGNIELSDLYKTLYAYMDTAKLSAAAAIQALEKNYMQGKAGSFEMKDLVKHIHGLLPMATAFGQTGEQATSSLVAMLQIFRMVARDAGKAKTMAEELIGKLSDPAYQKRIKKELGIDVSQEREAARARGADPLLHLLNLLADKLQRADPAAVGRFENGQIVGADPDKMGEIFRDKDIRAAIEAWVQKRDQLGKFSPGDRETQKMIADDFASAISTAAEATRRLSQAQEEAMIRLGETQLGNIKMLQDVQAAIIRKMTDMTGAAPKATAAVMGAGYWGSNLISNSGSILSAGAHALLWAHFLKGFVPNWMRNAGSAVGGAAKGVAKLPGQAAGAGLSRLFPNGVPMPTQNAIAAATRSATRGAVLGVITGAGQYGMDKAFDWGNAGRTYGGGYDPRAMLNRGVIGHGRSLLENLGLLSPQRAPQLPLPSGWERAGQAGRSIVDPAAYEAAKAQAEQTGQAMQASLAVTAKPTLDLSDLRQGLELASQLAAKLAALGPAMRQATGTLRGAARSTAALHDGYETN